METIAGIALNVILASAALVSMIINLRLNAAMSALKLEMSSKIDEKLAKIDEKFDSMIDSMRREITQQFVPGALDQERRANIVARLEQAEEEIKRNRDNLHDVRNRCTEVLLKETSISGQIGNLEQRVQIFVDQSHANHQRITRLEQASEKRGQP